MAIVCPQFPNSRKKKAYSEDELTELRQRINDYESFKRAARQSDAFQTEVATKAALRQSAQNEWQRLTGSLVSLSPELLPRLQDFLVAQFGIKQRGVISWIPGDYSVAGNVRRALVNTKKVAENIVLLEGRINSADSIQRLTKLLEGKRLGQRRLAELMDETLTTGQIPLERSVYNVFRRESNQTPSLYDEIADRKYVQYRQLMRDNGFSDGEIDSILVAARDVSTAFDRTAIAARAQGVAIPEQTDLGYLPRLYTSEMQRRFKDIKDSSLLDAFLQEGEVNLSTMHSRSRQMQHYLPIDSEFAAKILGIDADSLNAMMSEPLGWIRFLQENISTEQLDTLVDAGVMGKLPMSSREVFDWFRLQYELPYQYLDDAIVTDTDLLFGKYTESLMQSAGASALVNVFATQEARRAGWVVGNEVRQANPAMFSNFVPIGDSFRRLAKATRQSEEQLVNALGLPAETIEHLRSSYVHPLVARQWSAIMAVSINPAAMNTLGGMALRAGRWVNKRVLTNVQYVLRNTLSSVINNTAAGGSFATLPASTIDIQRVLSRGLEALDDTRQMFFIDGELLTRRGLMRRFLLKEGASSVPGTVSERVAPTSRRVPVSDLFLPGAVRVALLNPAALRRSFSYLIDYTFAHGDAVGGRRIPASERVGRLSDATFGRIGELMDDAYVPYATYAVLTEAAAKWNVYQSLARKADPRFELFDTAQQVVTSGQIRRFDTSEELSRHLNDYFVDSFDVGRTTAFVNNYLRPFATWAMANPTMQLRHVLRNPHLYLGYQRLRSLLNRPLVEDDKSNEYTIPGWIQEALPMFIGRNPNGDPYVLLPGNFDGGTDAFMFFNEAGEDIQRLVFGQAVGTPEERNAVAAGTAMQDFFLELASQMHVPFKVAIEQILNKETFSGRTIEQRQIDQTRTLNGVPLNGRIAHFVENLLPQIRQLDALNPFTWWGIAPSYDIYGNVIDPGRLSVFGTERRRGDEFLSDVSENFVLRALRIAGLNIRTLDYDRQYYRSVADLERTSSELARAWSSGVTSLRSQEAGLSGAYSEAEKERRTQQLNELAHLYTQSRIDLYRLETWATQQGLPTSEAIERLKTLRLNLRALPLPTGATLQREVFDRLNQDLPFLEDVLKRSGENRR